jgi:hypothetical protein
MKVVAVIYPKAKKCASAAAVRSIHVGMPVGVQHSARSSLRYIKLHNVAERYKAVD